jgi:hypothetical protein
LYKYYTYTSVFPKSHNSELEIIGDEAVMVYFRYFPGVTEVSHKNPQSG